MDKMKLYAVISPLCILLSQGIMPAQAQQLAGGKIQVDSVLARKNGNRMDVAFRMNLNDLKMKSEQRISPLQRPHYFTSSYTYLFSKKVILLSFLG